MSYESLSHSKWDCKYHVVFVSTKVGRDYYTERLRKLLDPGFHKLADQRSSEFVEGHRVQDHVPMPADSLIVFRPNIRYPK